jgi:nicotinamide-nucleotide amidase
MEGTMSLNLAVLTTGDELINGEMADTNTMRIAQMLGSHGYLLRESRSVGDDEGEIMQALRDLAGRRQAIIVTGGLGPTEDDLTARAAAKAFERRLALNDEALRQIREFFRQRRQEMHPRNEKQALLPQKAQLIPNPLGTAVGFQMRCGNCELFFLPGVPAEMTAMLEATVLPRLDALSGGAPPRQERILKVFGLSEPKVEERFNGHPLPAGVSLGFGVEFPFVFVKLRASGPEAEGLLDKADLHARQQLAPYVFGTGQETLAGNVGRMLTDAGLTLALAESCTGGLVSQLLTDIPGASAFLERAAVTYSNRAKQDWLLVPAEVLVREGAVSQECAMAMAHGVREAAGSDIGLAITGIAGPTGGSVDKPVGTVFLAMAAPGEEKVQGYRFNGSRDKIRLMAASMALEWLRRYLCAVQLEVH